jgi:GTP:adenosylcobinamide-phosphate guanylyltransferase
MRLAVLLLALAVVFLMAKGEGYQQDTRETFAEIKAQVTPDENNNMIFQTQQELVKNFKVCCHCIGTNKIQMFKDSQSNDVKHVARYMFMIMTPYPYGTAVDATFINDRLISAVTQKISDNTLGDIVPFKDADSTFMKYDQMAEKPSLVKLDDTSK